MFHQKWLSKKMTALISLLVVTTLVIMSYSVAVNSSETDLPAAKLLTELILHITGIKNPEIIKLLNASLTNRSREAGPLLAHLCQFASKYTCPSCVDSRPPPKTALDASIRLVYNETWNGLRLPVISAKDIGRLGNKMSEYSTVFALKKIYNVSAVVPRSASEALKQFFKGISLPVMEVRGRGGTQVGKDFRRSSSYQAAQLAAAGLLGPKPFLLTNYLVDLPLVTGFKEEIRQEFAFHESIVKKATARLHNFTSIAKLDYENEPITTVGVHVRLTDYPNHMRLSYKIGNVSASYESYLRRAVEYFRTRHHNVVFVATSDNVTATRELFDRFELQNVFVMQGTVAEDMCLLTLCDHNIITLGSFGFWIGYLGRGTTLYPELHDMKVEYPYSKPFYEKAQIEHFVPVLF